MPVKPKRVNPLLSKVEVGKPRESVLQLPPSDHIYGVASKRSGASRSRCRFSVSRPFSLPVFGFSPLPVFGFLPLFAAFC
jgi:hypothetical protein